MKIFAKCHVCNHCVIGEKKKKKKKFKNILIGPGCSSSLSTPANLRHLHSIKLFLIITNYKILTCVDNICSPKAKSVLANIYRAAEAR